jgi:DNA-binding PadR family transcriptional regulator
MELLTKLEEMVLIAVLRLRDKAYGISVYKHIVELTGNEVSVSSVYFPLERLVRKGYLQTAMGEPTSKRGDMSKRFYRLTQAGIKALQENRCLHETAWKGVSDILNTKEEV